MGLPVASQPPPIPTPLHGSAGEGLGNGIPRDVLRLVPPGATTAAEAGAVAASGEALVAGGALVAASGSVVLVCLTFKAALNGKQTPLDIADTFYGTHFGDLQGWAQGCYVSRAMGEPGSPPRAPGLKLASEPQAPAAPELAPDIAQDKDTRHLGRVYASYTKFNPKTGRYYAGRTSMVIDLRKPLRPQAEYSVNMRDKNHHIDERAEPDTLVFQLAALDRFDVGAAVNYEDRYRDVAYWRIRGREQQLMDFHGGAQSDTGMPYRTENVQRGVAKNNPLGRLFHDAATKHWGQLHPYTGD